VPLDPRFFEIAEVQHWTEGGAVAGPKKPCGRSEW
jgi:hypothetical protein